MYLYSKTTILGSTVSCLLFGVAACGGSYFTTADQAILSGEASQAKLDAPTDDGGTTQEGSDQPVNEAGPIMWQDASEASVEPHHDAGQPDQVTVEDAYAPDSGSSGGSSSSSSSSGGSSSSSGSSSGSSSSSSSGVLTCTNGGTACNGACVNFANDPANCGSCGNFCGGTAGCSFGTCSCGGGLVYCVTRKTCTTAANCT